MQEPKLDTDFLTERRPALSRGSNARTGSGNRIRVAIASSVRLVRDSLTLSLSNRDGIVVVDAVALDSESISRLVKVVPNVVLVDLGRTDAVTIARVLKLACPEAKLVAFALAEVDNDVFACAAAGFSGYVSREGGANEVYRAVIDAAFGRMHCSPHITAAMFKRLSHLLQQPPVRTNLTSLTARQIEIMELAQEGQSNKEIARRLQISSATVKNHIHNILQKLQVGRRGEAVARMRAARGN
jgi:two-component system, NarL family, nitrate/nitrite response regulator NarL